MRFDRLSVIDRYFILIFSMTSGKWFEFETPKHVLVDGGDLSLKAFFSL